MAEVKVAVQMDLLKVIAKQCGRDSQDWFPAVSSGEPEAVRRAVIHHALSLAGEVGEVANLVKKMDRGSVDLTNIVFQEDLQEEITDVFIYLMNLVDILGMDLLKAYLAKRDKNVLRFSKNGAKPV